MLTLTFNVQPAKASGTIYIRADGSIDPLTAPIHRDGDLYTLTDSITSEAGGIVIERDNMTLDGAGFTLRGMRVPNYYYTGILINYCNGIVLENITVTNFDDGIILIGSSLCRIVGNTAIHNGVGIYPAYHSNNNTVARNMIIANDFNGFWLTESSYNNIVENTIEANNETGIEVGGYCDHNFVSKNCIEANKRSGIGLWNTVNNTVCENNITDNVAGMELGYYSTSNSIYHNNFLNNTQQVVFDPNPPWANAWDDGYPSGGNYWSDYNDVDLYSGPYQNETGSDGIWDHKYVIDADNNDNYPFVNPWSEHIIDIPFHYQTIDYYCGPACLEMVFDYYGEDINQSEIADVARTIGEPVYSTFTDELRRAAHFSNTSTSMGDEMPGNITGYTLRQLGYAAFEQWSMTIDQLKTLIDHDFPIILLMWYSPHHVSGHYRVAVGYNNTHIMLHDPWNNVDWGGTYGGPYLAFNYSTFLDLWSYSGYWGLFTSPWNIEINTPSNIQQGDNFTVTANITYPCPVPFPTSNYPASLCNATITLPTGLIPTQGETSKKALGNILAGSSTMVNWSVKAESIGTYNITVEAEGKVVGSVGAHESFPSYSYEDRIGSSSNYMFEVLVGHDVSITNFSSSKTIIGQGYNTSINATIKNEGNYVEIFNLTVYANTTIIATTTNITLSSGNTTTVTFVWNTSGFAKGNYTIKAYAWPVQNETDTDDNTLPDGWVIVTIPGDVNGNHLADISDLVITVNVIPSASGWPNWNPNADINGDGVCDISDLVICVGNIPSAW
jgi:parallel beta-helix repeat protein